MPIQGLKESNFSVRGIPLALADLVNGMSRFPHNHCRTYLVEKNSTCVHDFPNTLQ